MRKAIRILIKIRKFMVILRLRRKVVALKGEHSIANHPGMVEKFISAYVGRRKIRIDVGMSPAIRDAGEDIKYHSVAAKIISLDPMLMGVSATVEINKQTYVCIIYPLGGAYLIKQ